MKNTVNIDLGKVTNSCFVVMPFSPIYQTEYENIIKPILKELNIECIRGDEIYSKQRIVDDIWASIRRSRFVLAELTGRNPNVLYEIGLAHAIGKPVIIITRNGDDVPFDLKDLRYLFYDVNDPFWGESLKTGIKVLVSKLIENPDLDKYLEGITKQEAIDFPKLEKLKKTQFKTKIPNISGNWIGSFELNGYHGVTLNITQNDNKLSANAIITVGVDNKKDVIQQIMAGSINSKIATLTGVNYSFVKRELLNNYILDSFEFNDFKNDMLNGKVIDEQSNNSGGRIKLTRIAK